MRKALAALVAGSLAVVALAVGALTLSPYSASAQEDQTIEQDTPSIEHTTLEDVLGELVGEGVITQEQADIVAERIRENAPYRMFGHHRGQHLETVADVLGMEIAELADALRNGQTIADIAGDETQAVIDTLVDEAAERLATAVENGRLTQEEADEKLPEITERVVAMVNGEFPPEGMRHGPHRGPFGGQGPADTTNDA